MNEVQLHASGVVATDVNGRRVNDVPVASFRLVATARRYDPRTGGWIDGDKAWFTVHCWRSLAGNVLSSVLKSERVIVTGRLRTAEWRDSEGRLHQRQEIVADAVGHDLTYGTTVLTRRARIEPIAPDARETVASELAEHLDRQTEGLSMDEVLAAAERAGAETGSQGGAYPAAGPGEEGLDGLDDDEDEADLDPADVDETPGVLLGLTR